MSGKRHEKFNPRLTGTRDNLAHRLTVTLATFMEVLDTSVATLPLPHIAGGLAAGQDESSGC